MKNTLARNQRIWNIILALSAICGVLILFSHHYLTQHTGVLESKTTWELESVVIDNQQRSPQEVFIHRPPPQILFVTWRDYKGTDGCNIFNGYYSYERNGNVRAGRVEEITRLGCLKKLGTNQSTGLQAFSKLDFLDVLPSITRYEMQSDKLILYFPEDQSNMLVFRPAAAPDTRMDMLFIRWECHVFPFLAPILNDGCWI